MRNINNLLLRVASREATTPQEESSSSAIRCASGRPNDELLLLRRRARARSATLGADCAGRDEKCYESLGENDDSSKRAINP